MSGGAIEPILHEWLFLGLEFSDRLRYCAEFDCFAIWHNALEAAYGALANISSNPEKYDICGLETDFMFVLVEGGHEKLLHVILANLFDRVTRY